MNSKIKIIWIIFCLLIPNLVAANVSVPAIFGDHMVLQQNAEIKLWGWGKPREKIIITTSWSNDTLITEPNNLANWSIYLKTPSAGGPYFIRLQGYNTLQINDVLIGEVWLLAGQSNMEWSARMGIGNADEAVKNATQNQIRFFSVTHRTANFPNYDIDGSWVVCSPQTMIDFSALGYFFAQKLNGKLNVPVGLINTSWGGTPIEVWIPEKGISNNQRLLEASKKITEMAWGPREPGRAHNAMIAPMMPFKIAGVLWYQGETNTANPEAYTEMLQTLISTWREGFKTDFPFYFAQIAPYFDYSPNAGVKVREAQRRVLSLQKTGMIVVSDIGDTSNIHPRKKLEAGYRFADLALSQCYGFKEFPVSGPLYSGFNIDGQKVIVDFKYSEGMYAKGGILNMFELAGADGKWYPAKATIKNNQVIVSASKVKKPMDVRFAWGNTATPNLFNSSNLPASCFNSQKIF